MKARTSIFSHIAVFAIGATIAVVANRPAGDSRDGIGAAGDGGSQGRSGYAAGSGTDDRSAVRRERRDSQTEKKTRTNEPAPQRMAEIGRMGDALDRQSALLELISRLGPDEFAAVADQYRQMNHYEGSHEGFDLIMRGWAKADPLGALAYAEKNPDGGRNTSLVLASWAGKDPDAAERWAIEKYKGNGANPFMPAVIRGIAAYDIARASRLTEAMPSGRERSEAVDAITRALFVQGVDAAIAYPTSIQDPKLRGGFVSAITSRLAYREPDKAAAMLASYPDADIQNRNARNVANALAKTDTAAAATWLRKLEPAAQAEAALGILTLMSSKDIAGTASWASSLAGIPNYDKVVEDFVWSCDYRAPEQSAAWIQGVSNPEQRNHLYYRMLGEWAKRDAPAVKNWVANNAVPPDVQKRFGK
jgi:hypothetical protein